MPDRDKIKRVRKALATQRRRVAAAKKQVAAAERRFARAKTPAAIAKAERSMNNRLAVWQSENGRLRTLMGALAEARR